EAPPPAPVVEHENLGSAIVGTIVRPARTLRNLCDMRAVGLAVGMIILYGVLSGIVSGLTGSTNIFYNGHRVVLPDTPAVNTARVVANLIFPPVVPAIGLAILTAIFWVSSKMFGGKGSYSGLFAGVTFASLVLYTINLVFRLMAYYGSTSVDAIAG